MATAASLPEQLIHLIIRFAASISDLQLPISSPRTTTTLSLKQLIRSHLPPEHASARLRLIYAGKVLPDTAPLSVSLKLPIPPPPRDGTWNEHGPGSKSKGKQFIRVPPIPIPMPSPPQEPKKLYIHCSLGDLLSPSDLATETALARASETTLRTDQKPHQHNTPRRASTSDISSSHGAATRIRKPNSSETTPAPQGFDRLLASGFTAQEVATLRSQFQTNLSYTHTPDTMPSPTQIRALEDRWLDSTATDPTPGMAGGVGEAGETGWGAGFSVEEGGLDDMLYGYLTGFFWPLGAGVWGFREEGVWTRRRQLAVMMGVLLNCVFGFMRWSS